MVLNWRPELCYLSGNQEGKVFLLETATLTLDGIFQPHRGGCSSIIWNGNGSAVVTAGADDKIRMWGIDQGSHLFWKQLWVD